jgi:AraC family transcriptional activator of tynA and feaB
MERVSTTGLPATGRMAAWNDLYSSHMSRVEFTPGDQQQFDAELSIARLGPVKLAKLSVDRCSIERTRRHLAQSPRLYSFLLQASGSSVFGHYGHEAHLSEGDFVLCDTGMPHYFNTDSPSVTVMVRVAPDVLREYLPSPEQFCGLHLGRAVGVTGTVAAMVRSLSDHGIRLQPGLRSADCVVPAGNDLDVVHHGVRLPGIGVIRGLAPAQ